MREPTPSHDQLIDAYLDGGLGDRHRIAFTHMIERSPQLRSEVQRQVTIDAALKRLMTPPTARRLADLARPAIDRARVRLAAGSVPSTPAAPARRRFATAAALVAAAGGILLIFNATIRRSRQDPYVVPARTTMPAYYHSQVDAGFSADWRCDTQEEFADAFAERLDQKLMLAELPDAAEALGFSYCNCLTPRTVSLMATVGDAPVMVFVDRVERDQPQRRPDGLSLYRRRIGRLVLYELSPLDHPAVIQAFFDPDAGDPGTRIQEIEP